jgi:hypothetical protein
MTSYGGSQENDAHGGLDVSEDPGFSAKVWRIERVAWSVMALLLVAALAGAFGNGPLSWREAGEPGGQLRLDYERFIRNQSPVLLRLRVGPGAADADGRVRLWISRRYLEGFKVEQLTPEPEWVEAAPDRTIFVVRLAEPAEPSVVIARLEAETVGSVKAVVGLESAVGGEGARVEFSQFVYP